MAPSSFKTVTIKDVASAADVSIATVSRVINHTGTVKPELAERVEQAVRTLNYSPNSVARSLKTSSTSTIAYLVSNISDPFFITIGRGIEDFIRLSGYSLIICSIDHSKELEASYIQVLREKKVDGIVLNTTGYNDDLISQVSCQIPTVLSNRRILNSKFRGDFIDTDNTDGTIALTNHLLSLGHRKIGVINGPAHLSTAYERYNGFAAAMVQAGIVIDKDYPYYYEGVFTAEEGYRGAQCLMEQEDTPTAIVIMSSELTFGALRYFSTHQVRIPEDVSIVCFGDLANRELLYVQPTIVFSNLTGLGNKMGELLLERITMGEPLPNREVRFTTQLLPGNSTRAIGDSIV